MAGPIEQFEVKPLVEITIGDIDLSFTNASAYMFLTVTLASSFLLLATGKARLVPGRWQSSAEMLYLFVAKTLRDNAGEQGMRFFPFVFSLFMFILFANMIGMFPYAFTVTSQIIVTFGLAMMVFGTVTLYGIFKHGIRFLGLFKPAGIPAILAPIIVPIEIISYISRPVSHSVRRSYHPEGLCRFCRVAGERQCSRHDRRHRAAFHDGRNHGAGVSDGRYSGLCVHDADLHVSQ